MSQKFLQALLIIPMLFLVVGLQGQSTNEGSVGLRPAACPASIIIDSVDITAASCPSNGAFTINTTPALGLNYQITAGPAGFPTAAQTSPAFNSLLPGTYNVLVFCQEDPNVSITTAVTVNSTYTQLAANSTVSNICTAGTPGIITTSATGSSTPYIYAYWQGNPAASDGTLTYTASNTFAPASFGTYNVRTKDACGIYVTQQVTVANPYPADLCVSSVFFEQADLSCTQLQDSIYSYITLSNNFPFTALPAAGIDVDVYSNTGTCENPVNTLISTTHFDNSFSRGNILVPKGVNLVYVVRTPCAQSCSYCYTYTAQQGEFLQNTSIAASGCVNPGDPVTYSISVSNNVIYTFPIKFVITNSAGVAIDSFTANSTSDMPHIFSGLPSGDYTSTATNGCGEVNVLPLTPSAGPLNIFYQTGSKGCNSIAGRATLTIYVSGEMANLANATAKIIAPSPNLIDVPATLNGSAGIYKWENAIPGATYYYEIDNGCGQKDTLSSVVPADYALVQYTNAAVTQLCGGSGNIVVDAAYSDFGSFAYQVTNSAGTIVGNGGQGISTFSNLPVGAYTVETTISGCGPSYSYSSQATIIPGGSGPQIIKKLGVVCEDGSGNPLTSGSAIVWFTGAQPLKVDYKLSSQPDAGYINVTDSSDGTETISGLLADTSYTIRVTDGCGNATIIEVSIGQLTPFTTSNTSQPCVGNIYTLSVPDFIDATYSWTKNGVVISTGREIIFPNYTAAEDGTYSCTVVIANCINRVVTTTLNSLLCSSIIQIAGAVINDVNSNTVSDNTETNTTVGTTLYVYLVNTSGIVVDSSQVLPNGTYTLQGNTNSSYTIELSTIQYAVGTDTAATPIVNTLSAGWVTTGENGNNNTGAGDGDPDGNLVVNTGTIDITQQNFGIEGVPTANPDYSVTEEDAPVTIPVLANDIFGSNGPSVGTISITDQPTNGTATVNNGGTPNNPADDQVVYTPNPGFNGSDTLIYQICDSDNDCDTALVVITISSINNLPVANPDVATTTEDTPVTIPVLVNDTFGGDGPSTGTITVTTQPTNGTATVNNGGTPTDPTDDEVVYTPNPAFTGSDTLIYQVCDNNGDCDTAMVVIDVLGVVPVTLSTFNLQLLPASVNVLWEVQQEFAVSNYEVEFSTNGRNFITIGTVAATGSTRYGMQHLYPVKGNNYYRLKMIDINGSATYSRVAMVRFGNSNITQVIVAPNPFAGSLQLKFNLEKAAFGTAKLYGNSGQLVYENRWFGIAGNNSITLTNFPGLAKGIYTMIITTDEFITVHKLIKR